MYLHLLTLFDVLKSTNENSHFYAAQWNRKYTYQIVVNSTSDVSKVVWRSETSDRQASLMHIIEKHIRSMNCLSYRVGNPILDVVPKNVSSLLPLHINKKKSNFEPQWIYLKLFCWIFLLLCCKKRIWQTSDFNVDCGFIERNH